MSSATPLYIALIASTLTQADLVTPPMPLLPGGHFLENYREALFSGMSVPVWKMMAYSPIMALGITIGKIIISLISAYAIVYFRFRFRTFFFWMIFLALMLPVEVRIVPTYEVVAGLKLLNSYSDLILPLMASATATFLFRQQGLSSFGCAHRDPPRTSPFCPPGSGLCDAEVAFFEELGAETLVHLRTRSLENYILRLESAHAPPALASTVGLTAAAEHRFFFDQQGRRMQYP